MTISATNRSSTSLALRPVEVERIDHIEFEVGNARQAARFLCSFGLRPIGYRGLETGCRDATSWLLSSGDARIVVTAPLGPDGPIADRVRLHGDAVRDIAFRVPDAGDAYGAALEHGVHAIADPGVEHDARGDFERATVGACGDLVHSLVSRSDGGDWLPGFVPIDFPIRPTFAAEAIDHVAIAVAAGEVDGHVERYGEMLGFTRMLLAGLDTIETDSSALMSRVVEGGAGKVKFTIVEPTPSANRSQVEEFLMYNRGQGVQHIGLLVDSVAEAAATITREGIGLVAIEDSYYEQRRDQIRALGLDPDAMARASVLIDEDEDGHLMQVFVRPIQDRPTFFFELVERHGSRGFGPSNVRHLFSALERDQAARGNL